MGIRLRDRPFTAPHICASDAATGKDWQTALARITALAIVTPSCTDLNLPPKVSVAPALRCQMRDFACLSLLGVAVRRLRVPTRLASHSSTRRCESFCLPKALSKNYLYNLP